MLQRYIKVHTALTHTCIEPHPHRNCMGIATSTLLPGTESCEQPELTGCTIHVEASIDSLNNAIRNAFPHLAALFIAARTNTSFATYIKKVIEVWQPTCKLYTVL